MGTSRKTPPTLTSLIFLCLIFAFCSCSTTSEDALTLVDTERIDMIISGDIELEDFNAASANSQNDLVSFNYYGNPSENFDFVVHLDNGYTLTIMMHDASRMNPWQQVGQPYNIYPGQDLDDKLYYTNITLKNGEGITKYSTNECDDIPPGYLLDVFKVIKNDGNQIQCRVRDMTLYCQNDPHKPIHINGTFVGVNTFE